MTKRTSLTENVIGQTYLLFHSRFIRYTSRFALCPPGQYAQRKAIPRWNLIKTIKLWKETSAEPPRSPGEKERKDKKREKVHETGSPDKIFFSYVYFRSIPSKTSHPFLCLSSALFLSLRLPFCFGILSVLWYTVFRKSLPTIITQQNSLKLINCLLKA